MLVLKVTYESKTCHVLIKIMAKPKMLKKPKFRCDTVSVKIAQLSDVETYSQFLDFTQSLHVFGILGCARLLAHDNFHIMA